MNHDNLIANFKKVGLELRLLDAPPRVNQGRNGTVLPDIFFVDIKRNTKGNTRTEWFEMFIPKDATVDIAATDSSLGQLVLRVTEPLRHFEEKLNPGWKRKVPDTIHEAAEMFRVRERDLVFHDQSWWIKRQTPKGVRSILMGLDERQIFMAQLSAGARNNCTSVKLAHDSLRAATVTLADGVYERTIRQGEWFFLPVDHDTCKFLDDQIKKGRITLEEKQAIGGTVRGRSGNRTVSGNPHTADQMVVIPGVPLDHGWPVRQNDIFIRGAVRHKDHKTVKFTSWKRVLKNRENNQGRGITPGSTWID